MIKIKFFKLWDLLEYGRTTSERPMTCQLLALYCGANCLGDTQVPFFADDFIKILLNLTRYVPNVMD